MMIIPVALVTTRYIRVVRLLLINIFTTICRGSNCYIKNQRGEFKALGDKVCDTIFTQLRKHSNMDSLFAEIVKQNKLGSDLEYSLIVTSLGVDFNNNHYFPLLKTGEQNPYLSQEIQLPAGIKIDGELKNINEQNLVTSLYVSSPLDHSYRIGFSLYVDTPNRYIAVLKQMAPILHWLYFQYSWWF